MGSAKAYHSRRRRRVQCALAAVLALGVCVIVITAGHGADAAGTASADGANARARVEQDYGVLSRGSAPSPDTAWIAHAQTLYDARGDALDNADVHRALTTANFSVDVYATDVDFCLRVKQTDGSGSINCVPLDATTGQGGVTAVDQVQHGIQVTMLAPNDVHAVRVSNGATTETIAVRNNVAVARLANGPATLTWTDGSGGQHTETASG
jgi:hypothetical protein